jgi:hypothetical protein
VVTITPKTPPPGEVKAEAKKVEAKKKVNTFYNPIYFNFRWNDGILHISYQNISIVIRFVI